MYQKIEKAAGMLWKFLAHLLALMMFALVAIVFWQVFCRFVLRSSTGWTSEISTVIFVWATYLGAALAIWSGSQISMNLVVQKVPAPGKQVIQIFAALVCEVFYGVFTASGIAAIQKFFTTTTPALRIPMPWVYGAFVVSGVIMLLYGLLEIIKPVRALTALARQPGKEKEGTE